MIYLKAITCDRTDQKADHCSKNCIKQRVSKSSPQRLLCSQVLKFCIKYVPGRIRPLDTSVDVLVAAEIIQYSGNTEINDTMIRKIYVGINLL